MFQMFHPTNLQPYTKANTKTATKAFDIDHKNQQILSVCIGYRNRHQNRLDLGSIWQIQSVDKVESGDSLDQDEIEQLDAQPIQPMKMENMLNHEQIEISTDYP